MHFAKIMVHLSRIAGTVLSAVRPCVLNSIDIWRFAKVACSSSLSLFLFFHFVSIHTLSLLFSLSLHVSLPSFSTSFSVYLPHDVNAYVHTYLPTFNDRYAFNCSPSPSPPRGRVRLSDKPSHSFRRYFPRRVIGVRDIEDRPRDRELQRGISCRYRRYRDVAMRRAAPRRGVDQLASLRLSPSIWRR